jgi:hypothetical protein
MKFLKNIADQQQAMESPIDLRQINQIFHNALQNGVIRRCLHIGNIKIKPAKFNSTNSGHLFVTVNDEYVGKISPRGKWLPIDSSGHSLQDTLVKIADDPLAAAVLHGQQTGTCSCCGRKLTNELSVELGIGPICRGNWGM